MKREMLERLIRICAKQVIKEANGDVPDTIGAPAPPAGGQGTADTTAIPTQKPTDSNTVQTPETPSTGIYLINPSNKSLPVRLSIKKRSDEELNVVLSKYKDTEKENIKTQLIEKSIKEDLLNSIVKNTKIKNKNSIEIDKNGINSIQNSLNSEGPELFVYLTKYAKPASYNVRFKYSLIISPDRFKAKNESLSDSDIASIEMPDREQVAELKKLVKSLVSEVMGELDGMGSIGTDAASTDIQKKTDALKAEQDKLKEKTKKDELELVKQKIKQHNLKTASDKELVKVAPKIKQDLERQKSELSK